VEFPGKRAAKAKQLTVHLGRESIFGLDARSVQDRVKCIFAVFKAKPLHIVKLRSVLFSFAAFGNSCLVPIFKNRLSPYF
jgi:hypothetical protein